MQTIAFRSTWKHLVLEELIKEIDSNQDLTRTGITMRAIKAADDVKDWAEVKEELSLLRRDRDNSLPIAKSMQIKIDNERSEKVQKIRQKMLSDLKIVMPELQRLLTPYFILLLWMNYLIQLKKEKIGSKSSSSELSGPEMVKRLTQILILNRKSDRAVIEAVKKILIQWEE